MTPDRLVVTDKGSTLRITWPDGCEDEIDAVLLRQESRSAGSRRARIDDRVRIESDVRILSVSPVGSYAVNIGFTDGESRGIYPWTYLAQLAARGRTARLSASDFMIEGEPA
jgi:DUF971 family protein